MSQSCSACSLQGEDLKRCAGCKTTLYCSKICQRNHWRTHKPECKELQEKASERRETTKPKARGQSSELRRGKGRDWILTDNLTGSINHYDQFPFNSLLMAPPPGSSQSPSPSHRELSRVASKLESSLPHPNFFRPADGGQKFRFITDMSFIPPELVASTLPDLQKTVLIAKIVRMDGHLFRHGIRIMDEVSEHRLVVLFYVKDDNPYPYFKWGDVRPGNYICVHAPAFHSFMDGQVGFRIDRANQVRILSTSGEVISV
ncbi:uncharacterized protein LOC135479155 [Liolophura sinensis]|uniref:uncharacterized protein LOC135479155 n=1 Tax=Liolophura sinensis TaxID=3198878 RepID=UPI00315944A0